MSRKRREEEKWQRITKDKNKKENKTNKRYNLILELKLWYQNYANLKDKMLKPTHLMKIKPQEN